MSNSVIDFEAIRVRNPLPEYCERRGIRLRRSGEVLVGKCPLHSERNGESFVVFPDGHWHCFGKCQRSGDVIDLEQGLGGGTLPEAAERLGGERAGQVKEPNTPPKESTPVMSEENPFGFPYRMSRPELTLCLEAATRLALSAAQIQKVANWRGWKPVTIRNLALEPSLGIDSTGRLCFLYESGCKLRWRSGGERQIRWAFGKPWLWRGGYIARALGTVFITEGETDAVSLIDSGLEEDAQTLVVALPSASFSIEPWASLLADKKVIIATDCDEAGERAAERLFKVLGRFARSLEHFPLEGARNG
jgi:hypothetical protein